MTLTEAKDAIRRMGTPFGEVFLKVEEHNRDVLKEWYVSAEGVPNFTARNARQPLPSGNLCKCGGMLIRTGTCETCQSCGGSTGGCG